LYPPFGVLFLLKWLIYNSDIPSGFCFLHEQSRRDVIIIAITETLFTKPWKGDTNAFQCHGNWFWTLKIWLNNSWIIIVSPLWGFVFAEWLIYNPDIPSGFCFLHKQSRRDDSIIENNINVIYKTLKGWHKRISMLWKLILNIKNLAKQFINRYCITPSGFSFFWKGFSIILSSLRDFVFHSTIPKGCHYYRK